MKCMAYYIHWVYGPLACEWLKKYGVDDSRLFHRKKSAIAAAKDILRGAPAPEYCIDDPIGFTVLKKEIKFED